MEKRILQDLLTETGQELDSDSNPAAHKVGQVIMFLAQMLRGVSPTKAAQNLLDYERLWRRGETPYATTEFRQLWADLEDADVLDDRAEYDLEDVQEAYPYLSTQETEWLYQLFQEQA